MVGMSLVILYSNGSVCGSLSAPGQCFFHLKKTPFFWLLFMFNLVKDAFGFRLEIISGSLGQGLFSPHQERPLSKEITNCTSDDGFMNLQLRSDYPYQRNRTTLTRMTNEGNYIKICSLHVTLYFKDK